jgi:formate dehydrogenase alpha subunit
MVVYTDSPVVIEARKTNLELLLANHPDDCLTCNKSGDCRLQDYAYYYGVKQGAFKGEKHNYPIEEDNPFIVRDMNKCILCGKCIRMCEEIQGNDVINFAFRGFNSIVTPAMGLPYSDTEVTNCVFCGNCVSVCPVGALSEKGMIGKGRRWEVQKVKTTCPYCGVGCQLDLNIKGGKVIGVTSIDNDLNGRSMCVKGRFGYGFIHHPDRLTTPLIKKDGEFVEATWDEAIGLMVEKLGSIKNKYGPDALGLLSSARVTNEENYLMNKLARAVIGTNNIDHCARLCHAPTVAGMATAYGSGAMTNSFAEIKNADFILITGTNTTDTHPVAGAMIKQAARKGATLVAVDPRKTELSRMANYHLQIKSGTDIALINGLANVIIAEDLWDKDFVKDRTEDFDAFEAAVSKYTPDFVEDITGIPAETIREVARGYAKANNAMIFFTMGITQHICGTHNVFSIANLCMLCGQIGKESSGVNPLRGQNNVQGACDMGALPVVYTGYQGLTVEENRKKFAAAWKVKELPPKIGLTVGELLGECGKGIKGMYIMGENPILSDPDANNVMHELESLDFLVVQDIFLTETAQLADVVLPGASFAEKDGTFSNTERRVQLVRKAIDPIGNSKPDWEIICLVATAMGYPMSYGSAGEIMDEIASLTPSYAGISFARLEKGGLQWPCPSADHPGTKFLHSGKFARGLGKFHAVEHIPPDELPDNEYPFILSTGRRRYHYHTGSMTQRTGALEVFYPTEYLEVCCKDAEKLGVCDGDKVRVTSRRGEVEVAVKITDTVVPGLVFTSFQYPDVPINKLTNPARDPISKIPDLKVCAVKVEKAS